MSYQIRLARAGDAPALAELLHDLGQFNRINSEPLETTLTYVTAQLERCLADESHRVMVAEDGGQLLGYLSVHWLPYLFHTGPEGYVSELFVRPAARAQGVGTALLDEAVRVCRERGCARMMLINIRERESYRRGFYKKHGWEEREDAANFVLYL